MLILAVDTSTNAAGVVLVSEMTPISLVAWHGTGNHSRHLTGATREALNLGGASVGDLSAVVVAIGPGSFSGIRVGVSEAKGLAVALGIPLVGIPTLDAIALEASSCADSVWALIPAGRGSAYAAHFTGSGDTWARQGDYRILDADELSRLKQDAEHAAGSVVVMGGDGAAVDGVAEAARAFTRPCYLAELGRRYLAAGGADQLHTAEPLYLRRSAAEEKANRQ